MPVLGTEKHSNRLNETAGILLTGGDGDGGEHRRARLNCVHNGRQSTSGFERPEAGVRPGDGQSGRQSLPRQRRIS